MPFTSYEFVFAFLPATVCIFWMLLRYAGQGWALGWLLTVSILFSAYTSLVGVLIVVPSILLDYGIARIMLRENTSQRLRTRMFAAAIVCNVLFLGYFKYRNFFLDTANTVLSTHFEPTQLILPLGISFLVFQKIAFLADVRSGDVRAVRFPDFLLFTFFFPRTVAGPIVHYEEFVPQLRAPVHDTMIHLVVGICLFSIGLFKKTVVADGVGQFVTPVFDSLPHPNALLADLPPTMLVSWISALAYTLQLYFDFSGYSDMALGTARMVGVRLPMNFNSPLKAGSIVEFWGRWHITLTRFLTAYIYTPIVLWLTRTRIAGGKPVLRGKRSSPSAISALIALPTLATMAISGLWHGAGWQFILWGLLHGVYITINQTWRVLRPRFWPDPASYQRVMRPIGRVLTLGSVVVAMALFRSSSVVSALEILEGMIGLNGVLPNDIQFLRNAAIPVTRGMLEEMLPVAAMLWITALLLTVNLLPNSLELLRRFRPAVDFPSGTDVPSGVRTRTRLLFRLVRIGNEGIDLSPVSAFITALLSALGVMAIGTGSRFIYGQF